MKTTTVRSAFLWIIAAGMAAMLAATIGLAVYVMLSTGGDPGTTGNVTALVVTAGAWLWTMRLLWVRRTS